MAAGRRARQRQFWIGSNLALACDQVVHGMPNYPCNRDIVALSECAQGGVFAVVEANGDSGLLPVSPWSGHVWCLLHHFTPVQRKRGSRVKPEKDCAAERSRKPA